MPTANPAPHENPASSSLKIPFGLAPDGQLYESGQVPNGNACGCVCPGCRKPIQAVHPASRKVTPYFRHIADCNCATGYESAVHLAAKQLIAERMAVWCPPLIASYSVVDALSNRHPLHKELCPPALTTLRNVQRERGLHGITPDIVADSDIHGQMLIEIAFTHFVDGDKLDKLRKNGSSAIEIDVSHLRTLDFQVLASVLFEPSTHTKWLFHPALNAAIRQFREDIKPTLDEAKELSELQRRKKKIDDARLQEVLKWQNAAYAQLKQNAAAREAQFHSLTAIAKQEWLERRLGPISTWPEVLKTFNRHASAVEEHPVIWQAALYLKFVHKTAPRKDALDYWDAVAWMRKRFHCVESDEVLHRALRYFLKVLCNHGVLSKQLGGRYLVICDDPAQFHRVKRAAETPAP